MTSQHSTNPDTKNQYNIPDIINDSENIDDFLSRFPGRKVVVVQGLGFVGAVMSIVCANAEGADYAVIGIDLPGTNSYWKICEINAGHFPIRSSDPNVGTYFENARRQGNFYATYDPYAFSKADVIIVDINLDVDKQNGDLNELLDYDVNLGGFRKAMESIGQHCREEVLVIVESTVPPGTCHQVVYPVIRKCLADRGLDSNKLLVGHSYERVMPGPDYVDSIKNFYRVYSGINEPSADATERFLRTFISTEKYPLTRLGNTNATEMAKVLENSYRAMNIAFIVEWSRFAEEAGVNLYEVVNAIRMRPTHSNIMFPGIGVGGYCLTKDALLASWSRVNLFGSTEKLLQSEKGIAINDLMPWYAFNFIKKQTGGTLQGKKVLILGVSYRSDVADTRYSPVEYLCRFLMKEQAIICLHDPFVGFWEEMSRQVPNNLPEVMSGEIEILVFATSHGEYRSNSEIYHYIETHPNTWVFDLVGVVPDEFIQNSRNQRIRVLGRGDVGK